MRFSPYGSPFQLFCNILSYLYIIQYAYFDHRPRDVNIKKLEPDWVHVFHVGESGIGDVRFLLSLLVRVGTLLSRGVAAEKMIVDVPSGFFDEMKSGIDAACGRARETLAMLRVQKAEAEEEVKRVNDYLESAGSSAVGAGTVAARKEAKSGKYELEIAHGAALDEVMAAARSDLARAEADVAGLAGIIDAVSLELSKLQPKTVQEILVELGRACGIAVNLEGVRIVTTAEAAEQALQEAVGAGAGVDTEYIDHERNFAVVIHGREVGVNLFANDSMSRFKRFGVKEVNVRCDCCFGGHLGETLRGFGDIHEVNVSMSASAKAGEPGLNTKSISITLFEEDPVFERKLFEPALTDYAVASGWTLERIPRNAFLSDYDYDIRRHVLASYQPGTDAVLHPIRSGPDRLVNGLFGVQAVPAANRIQLLAKSDMWHMTAADRAAERKVMLFHAKKRAVAKGSNSAGGGENAFAAICVTLERVLELLEVKTPADAIVAAAASRAEVSATAGDLASKFSRRFVWAAGHHQCLDQVWPYLLAKGLRNAEIEAAWPKGDPWEELASNDTWLEHAESVGILLNPYALICAVCAYVRGQGDA